MAEAVVNAFETTLAEDLTAGETAVDVNTAAGKAADFRVIIDPGGANEEYVKVTGNGTTTTWTVSRGLEGSTATSHTAGETVVAVITEATLQGGEKLTSLHADTWDGQEAAVSSPAGGHLLIYDGNDSWDNAAISGDATLAADGTLSLATDAVDAIGEIAAALRTGSDAKLVTGTTGTSGNLAEWNADGDLIDAGIVESNVFLKDASRALTGALDAGGNKLTNIADGTAASDAASKGQLDAAVNQRVYKDAVRAAATGNIDLASATDPNPVDGVTLADGDRVLLPNQTTASENGIYEAVTATDPTTWVRTSDADEDAEVTAGAIVPVEEGTTNAEILFLLTTDDPITVGTTSLSFTKISTTAIVGGDGISKSGNTLSVAVADFAGTGLESDGNSPAKLRIAASAAGTGLTGGGGSALSLDATSDLLNDVAKPNATAAGQLLIWNATNGRFENATLTGGNAISVTNADASVKLAVASNSIQTDELDLGIAPTWTGQHTFNSTSKPVLTVDQATDDPNGSNALIANVTGTISGTKKTLIELRKTDHTGVGTKIRMPNFEINADLSGSNNRITSAQNTFEVRGKKTFLGEGSVEIQLSPNLNGHIDFKTNNKKRIRLENTTAAGRTDFILNGDTRLLVDGNLGAGGGGDADAAAAFINWDSAQVVTRVKTTGSQSALASQWEDPNGVVKTAINESLRPERRDDDGGGTNRMLAAWDASFVDSTASSFKTRFTLLVNDVNGEREAIRAEGSGSAAKIGFFGGTAVTQRTRAGQLTDNSGGTVDGAVAAVSGSGADSTINDNFAEVLDRLNKVEQNQVDYNLAS